MVRQPQWEDALVRIRLEPLDIGWVDWLARFARYFRPTGRARIPAAKPYRAWFGIRR